MGKFGSAIKAGQTAIELGQNAQGLANAASQFRSADKAELGRQAGSHAFNEGAETGKTMGKTWLKTFEVVPRLVCRSLQFLFALIACGFYGNRVDADDDANRGLSPEWIFAIVVAGASATTAILFLAATPLGAIPYVGSKIKFSKTYRVFPWDLGLFVLWIIAFGIFGSIFLGRDSDNPYKGSSTSLMKVAVWIDFVNALLWLISGVYGAIKTFLGEKADEITDKVGKKLFEKKKKPAKEADYAESV
ncbi:hypothetical protein BKA56DRAFT_576202 [Ilyonectria sp. MPI-CAGE-AT-0026]|nr:hypothetical protein BKA56DRAFT_576202 [Ilyonectria sp. MPI-CAGE-AT-0026]